MRSQYGDRERLEGRELRVHFINPLLQNGDVVLGELGLLHLLRPMCHQGRVSPLALMGRSGNGRSKVEKTALNLLLNRTIQCELQLASVPVHCSTSQRNRGQTQ